MRISDWSSDVCSSDLKVVQHQIKAQAIRHAAGCGKAQACDGHVSLDRRKPLFGPNLGSGIGRHGVQRIMLLARAALGNAINAAPRSEEHTSELQSLMRISYDVFCLTKKNTTAIHEHIR